MIGEFKIFGTKLNTAKKLIVILKWILLFWALSAAIAILGTFAGRIGRPPPSPYEIHRMWVGMILTGAGFSKIYMSRLEWVFRDPIGNLVFIFKGANRKVQIRFQQQTEAEIENIVSIANKDRDDPLTVVNRDRLSNFILRNIDPDMRKKRHGR